MQEIKLKLTEEELKELQEAFDATTTSCEGGSEGLYG